jgi:hypothetical protein
MISATSEFAGGTVTTLVGRLWAPRPPAYLPGKSDVLTARKDRLAGHAHFDIDRYPRITYRLDIAVEGCLDLRSLPGALVMDRQVSLYRKDELLAPWRQ